MIFSSSSSDSLQNIRDSQEKLEELLGEEEEPLEGHEGPLGEEGESIEEEEDPYGERQENRNDVEVEHQENT